MLKHSKVKRFNIYFLFAFKCSTASTHRCNISIIIAVKEYNLGLMVLLSTNQNRVILLSVP